MEINVLEFFEHGALRHHPQRVGFVDRHDSFTFAEIHRHARNIAAALVALNPAINRPVAVLLPKCAKCLVADLGILESGNFYMNLDDQAPVSRTRQILANVRPILLIATRPQESALRALEYPASQILWVEDLFAIVGEADAGPLRARRDSLIDTDPVCLINTSGSTGIPKSVALSHRGLIDFVNWWDRRFTFSAYEVVGSLSPFFFDGYIVGFLMSLLKGARVEVLPGELAIFPAKLVQYLAERNVTFIFWVPSIMVTMANFKLFDKTALPQLKTVCFAGEVFPTRHLNYWRRHLPHTTFINLYGPIEISVICTYYVVDREFLDDAPLPIGFPCRNTDVLILNEADQPCVQDEPGELCVRGGSLAHGYWNDPVNTSRAFVQNPLNSSYPELIYRTGDVVYRNSRQEIMFVGRKDFQIKHLGFRFDLGEIEHFVLQIPGIDNACVCYHGPRKELHLFFEAKQPVTPAFIRERLATDLQKHMWPTQFHQLPMLPRNPNGKIDRRMLAASIETDVPVAPNQTLP